MKVLVFHTPKHVSVDTVEDPMIEHPRDAVLRVEFMGLVEECGSEVKNLQRGDRVVVPFPIACGQCWFCRHGAPTQCENSNKDHYGPEGGLLTQKGGALFGYTDL